MAGKSNIRSSKKGGVTAAEIDARSEKDPLESRLISSCASRQISTSVQQFIDAMIQSPEGEAAAEAVPQV